MEREKQKRTKFDEEKTSKEKRGKREEKGSSKEKGSPYEKGSSHEEEEIIIWLSEGKEGKNCLEDETCIQRG